MASAVAVLSPALVHGQHWSIATCSNTGSTTYGPMNSASTANATNRTAIIFPSSQLTSIVGKTLTHVYFQRTTTSGSMAGTPNFKVYLKEVSAADWGSASITWATEITGATLVYDSNPASIVGSTAGWKQFPLSTNFVYSGSQNLAMFCEYANATASTSISWSYEFGSPCINTSNSNTTKYTNNTTGTPSATLGTSNYRRPLIGFDTLQPLCTGTVTAGTPTPAAQNACTGTTPSVITGTGATAGASGLVYQWEESDDNGVADPWASVAGGSGANTLSFTPPAYLGSTIYYRLKVTCTGNSATNTSAAVTVNPMANPGTAASALTFTGVTSTGMTIGWTSGNGSRRYVVVNTTNTFTNPVNGQTAPAVVGTSYSGAGEQIVYDGTGTSVTISGLSCNSTYYARVYEYNRCGSAAPYDHYFNTATATGNPSSQLTIQPSSATLPVNNTFTGYTGSNLPTAVPGWYEASITTAAGSSPTHSNPQERNGSWVSSSALGGTTAKVNLYTNTLNDWIVSPKVSITSASQLRFKAALTDYNSGGVDPSAMQGTDDSVLIMVSSSACGNTWTPIYVFSAANTTTLSNTLTDYILPLNAYIGQTIQIAFQGTDGPINDAPDYDFHIGNVVIEVTPACNVPTGVNVSPVTAGGATINWTAPAPAPANGYLYYYSTSSAAPGSSISGSTGAGVTTANLTGLAATTTYYVWVRSLCGAGDTSSWAGPTTFTTPLDCNTATTIASCGSSQSFSLNGAGAYDLASATPAGPYSTPGKEKLYSFTAPVTGVYTLSVTTTNSEWADYFYRPAATGCGLNGWTYIDDVLSAGTDTFSMTGGTTYLIMVDPEDTALTSHTFQIVCPPTCGTPTTLTASAITTSSASLGWTQPAPGTPAQWQISYGPGISSPAAGTLTTAGSNPFTLPGLNPATGYTFYVRAICGAGDTSTWSSSASFTTQCLPSTLPFSENFNSTTFQPTCWSLATGSLGATLTPVSSGNWGSDGYLNNLSNTRAARINLYTTNRKDWLISPSINLGSTPANFVLEFSAGIIVYSSSTTVTNPTGTQLGSDDTVAVVISTDNGATWSPANALRVWTAANTPINASGSDRYYIPLNGYSGQVKIGFFGSDGPIDDTPDNDVFIDSVGVTVCNKPTVALGNDTVLCTGSALSLTAGTAAVYQWSTGATTQSISLSTPGTYWVKAATANPGCFATDTIVVTSAVAPVVALGNDTTVCQGATMTLNAGNPGASYSWNTGATTQSISVAVTGSYRVAVTNSNGCVGRDTVVVTVSPLPVVALGNDTAICQGSSLILNAGNAGAAYSWSTGATTQTINAAAAGSYHVAVTSAGCVGRDTIAISVNPSPVVSLGNDTTICQGSTLTLDAGNAGAAYSWSTGATTQTISAGTTGSYSVAVTNASNCTGRDTLALNINPLPVAGTITVVNTSPAFGFSAAGAQNATGYSWDFGDGSPAGSGQSVLHTYTANGTYTITLTVTNDCGSATATTTVTVGGVSVGTVPVSAADLKLYPNPAAGIVYIDNVSALNMEHITVTNAMGAVVLVKDKADSRKESLDISSLSSGVYTVRISTDKGVVIRQLQVLH